MSSLLPFWKGSVPLQALSHVILTSLHLKLKLWLPSITTISLCIVVEACFLLCLDLDNALIEIFVCDLQFQTANGLRVKISYLNKEDDNRQAHHALVHLGYKWCVALTVSVYMIKTHSPTVLKDFEIPLLHHAAKQACQPQCTQPSAGHHWSHQWSEQAPQS